jgi:hypothetical protein
LAVVVFRYTGQTDQAPVALSEACKQVLASMGNGWECHDVLVVGPSKRSSSSFSAEMRVKFVGDFALPVQLRDFGAKYYLAPEARVALNLLSHPQVRNGKADTMLVDKDRVDLTGGSCDRIGVSYRAFRAHGYSGGCSSPKGTCLGYQPKDLWESDTAHRAAGRKGEFFVGNFGEFEDVQFAVAEGTLFLVYRITQVQTSLVTIEISADDASIWTNISPARIVSANIGDFEALATAGHLEVVVQNTGNLAAMYSLSVACVDVVKPVPALEQEILPQRFWTATFEIHAMTSSAIPANCGVTLLNGIGTVLASTTVRFSINATCICLGSCDCACAEVSIEDCLSEDSPDVDEGVESGGGFSLRSIFDKLGISFGLGVGLLAGLGSLAGLFVLFKLGALSALGRCLSAACGGHDNGASTPLPTSLSPPPLAGKDREQQLRQQQPQPHQKHYQEQLHNHNYRQQQQRSSGMCGCLPCACTCTRRTAPAAQYVVPEPRGVAAAWEVPQQPHAAPGLKKPSMVIGAISEGVV